MALIVSRRGGYISLKLKLIDSLVIGTLQSIAACTSSLSASSGSNYRLAEDIQIFYSRLSAKRDKIDFLRAWFVEDIISPVIPRLEGLHNRNGYATKNVN
ncbi:hypothetical protein K449DRAFT_432348 [Hypoxylon sp. EC38]|nr:hypothetical protein K449DRAFT_432348 [Hypoxylon sp. EC38]